MKKLIIALFIGIAMVLLAPLVVREAFFRLPAYSAAFDCDDATLLMMERLQGIGINGTPMLGNLKMNGELYQESDHIWLLAEIAGSRLAFDKGVFYMDRQHYEGFPLSKQQLLEFIAQDYQLMAQMAGPSGL